MTSRILTINPTAKNVAGMTTSKGTANQGESKSSVALLVVERIIAKPTVTSRARRRRLLAGTVIVTMLALFTEPSCNSL
jgi:hypothetical protein